MIWQDYTLILNAHFFHILNNISFLIHNLMRGSRIRNSVGTLVDAHKAVSEPCYHKFLLYQQRFEGTLCEYPDCI